MVGFLAVCFLRMKNPTPRKMFALGKSGPNATFNLIFLGLGWPWVGNLVGFITTFICYPIQQDFIAKTFILTSLCAECWVIGTILLNVLLDWY